MNKKTFIRNFKTPVGQLRLEASEKALISIEFSTNEKRNDASKILDLACKELKLYFEKKLEKFSVPLEIKGTDFQEKCWKELKKIKYGSTISYKEEAIKMGGPNYARAVAGANNKNKFPIIIPCHRVIGSNGSMVGYAGGIKFKEFLLKLESDSN